MYIFSHCYSMQGSVSYVLMSCLVTAVQVFLRAGWSLGNVQDRYIFAGAGGDQVVGRAVSGLPTTTVEFSTLAPHFSSEDATTLNSIGWENIIPNFDQYPEGFRYIFPFLVASIIHHQDYLRGELDSSNHPLFGTYIFQKTFSELNNMTLSEYFKGKTLTGIGFCPDTKLCGTGIPPSVAILNEVNSLKNEIKGWKVIGESRHSELMRAISKIPEMVISEVNRTHHSIDGQPLTYAVVQQLVAESNRVLLESMRSLMTINNTDVTSMQLSTNTLLSEQQSLERLHFWDSDKKRIPHYLPERYSFEARTLQHSWRLWFHGDREVKIFPMKLFYEQHRTALDLTSKSSREQFSRFVKIMIALDIPSLDGLDDNAERALYEDKVLNFLKRTDMYGDQHDKEFYFKKMTEVKISTLYNRLTTSKAIQENPNPPEEVESIQYYQEEEGAESLTISKRRRTE